jgi:hypothetical protein
MFAYDDGLNRLAEVDQEFLNPGTYTFRKDRRFVLVGQEPDNPVFDSRFTLKIIDAILVGSGGGGGSGDGRDPGISGSGSGGGSTRIILNLNSGETITLYAKGGGGGSSGDANTGGYNGGNGEFKEITNQKTKNITSMSIVVGGKGYGGYVKTWTVVSGGYNDGADGQTSTGTASGGDGGLYPNSGGYASAGLGGEGYSPYGIKGNGGARDVSGTNGTDGYAKIVAKISF